MTMPTDAHAAKEAHADALLADPNVASVGVGLDDDGNETVVVGVKDAAQPVSVPQGLDTADYEVREVGEFVPEVAETQVAPHANHRTKHRPVPGGVSVGHTAVTAGTASFLLTDGETTYTASNAHVYADINAGEPGDTIIQPGSADGGTEADKSATLADSVPIEANVTVDLAWAEPVVEHTTQLLDLAKPTGEPRRAEVGEEVTKSGRTTQVTTGTVEQVNVDARVGYGGDVGDVFLKDQIVTTDMSDPGDSGSAVIATDDDAPVGLLFAGSSNATLLNQAVNVESASGLEIATGEGGGGETPPTATVTLTLTKQTPDTGNVGVAVEDQNGNAVSGATVSISGEESAEATTNADGSAVFEGVPIGSYTVSASAEGYDGSSVSVSASDFS